MHLIRFCVLSFVLSCIATTALASVPPPYQGMWWDPDRPGSGVSISMTEDGGWFVALYGQSESGEPIFLTAQGEELDFEPAQQAGGSAPHGIMQGPMLETRLGACLTCAPGAGPVTEASAIGDIVIRFMSPTQAKMTLAEQTWNLVPFLRTVVDPLHFNQTGLYLVRVANDRDEAVALAAGHHGRGVYFTGVGGSSLRCLSCAALVAPDNDPEFPERVRRMVESIETTWGRGPFAETSGVFVYDESTNSILFDLPYRFHRTAEDGVAADGFDSDEDVPEFAATRLHVRPLPADWRIGAVEP